MPSADEFDTCEAASQQNQHCKSTDVDRAPPHGCKDAAPAQGDHRQRHGHARPELPPRGGSVPRLAAQRAVAAVQAGGAERPVRVLARASAASPIDRIPVICSRAQDLAAGEVPRVPDETGIVKHQRAIGASFVAAALVAVLIRFVQRRRKGGGGSSKKKKSRPPSKKKAS